MAPQEYWARRNARAQTLGYKNYYDYRAHDNGRLPPAAPRLRGPELARSRGHRSAADLERLLRSGKAELVSTMRTVDAKGNVVVDVLVTKSDGSTVEYRLRGKQVDRVAGVLDDMGTDAPQLVGSPRAVATFTEPTEDESDEPELKDFDDYDGI